MASTFESFLILILFTLLIGGVYSQCSLQDIIVGTKRTSREIQGKQEWKAMFINNCKCPQQNLIVLCKDYQTAEKVDPNVFKPIGNNLCVVNGGQPIAAFASVEFLYAWDPPFIFVPQASQVHC